ncbi:1,3-beta-glucanosyltransferase gas1 [Haplosporangium sp. Z 11]|nr:1,3-beta-glucanosyltransferase gas1 [Haplosporangium sp. Z 11]
MRMLDEAGIYLVLGLMTLLYSIVRDSPQYDINIWNDVRKTIDEFQEYSNTLEFFARNEVSNDRNTTVASAYVKALIRDVKTHTASTASRNIPVGYANNDDPDIRLQVHAYFNCDKEEERAVLFGVNLYEWCGTGVICQTSSYANRTQDFGEYSVPVFLSEYRCNLVRPRAFPKVKSILGPDMTGAWSGGDFYEWSREENDYGLFQIKLDDPLTLLPDYSALKMALTPLDPSVVKMDSFEEQRSASICPVATHMWEPSTNLPPTPSSATCDCTLASLSCTASNQAVVSSENLGSQLDMICGLASCDNIGANGKTGTYGKYAYCSPAQKLSDMYNCYYTNIGRRDPSSCNFSGMTKLTVAVKSSDTGCTAIRDSYPETTLKSIIHRRSGNRVDGGDVSTGGSVHDIGHNLSVDLLNPSHALEQKTHKLKRLVQSPNSYFMDVKCPGCVQITTVFSHAQTVVMCSSCANVLAQPTGGITRLTEGCSFRRKQA